MWKKYNSLCFSELQLYFEHPHRSISHCRGSTDMVPEFGGPLVGSLHQGPFGPEAVSIHKTLHLAAGGMSTWSSTQPLLSRCWGNTVPFGSPLDSWAVYLLGPSALLPPPSLWFFCFSFCCSVAKLCPSLCNPMDCSTLGFLALYYLPEFVQTYVHWVSDTVQPSHPLLSPSPPALNLSQYLGLFQWVSPLH